MGRNGVKRQKQLRLYSCNGAKEALLFYTSIMSMSIIVNMEITVSDFHGMIIAAKKLLWTMLSVKFIITLFTVCCLSFVYWLSATPPVVSTLFFISCEAERVQSKICNTHTHTKKSLSQYFTVPINQNVHLQIPFLFRPTVQNPKISCSLP